MNVLPTYEYRCEACGVFDYFQNITADPLQECPTCGKSVQRLISRNGNIIFKGSGWHITDYRNDSSQSPSGSTDSAAAEAASSAD